MAICETLDRSEVRTGHTVKFEEGQEIHVEQDIQHALEINGALGPFGSNDFKQQPVMVPDDSKTIQKVLAAIIAIHFPSEYMGEMTIDGRTLRLLHEQGIQLQVISDGQSEKIFPHNGHRHERGDQI